MLTHTYIHTHIKKLHGRCVFVCSCLALAYSISKRHFIFVSITKVLHDGLALGLNFVVLFNIHINWIDFLSQSSTKKIGCYFK